jgi:hypothetical protein
VQRRAAERQRDAEREASAEQSDRVDDDQWRAAGAEPVEQPDRVATGVRGEEAR